MNNNEIDIELLRATLNAGLGSLKTYLIINGAAALSILTFIGKLTEEHSGKISFFANSLLAFTMGIIFVSLGSGLAYITQACYQNYQDEIKYKVGKYLNYLTVFCVFCSLISFCCGVYSAYCVFKNSF